MFLINIDVSKIVEVNDPLLRGYKVIRLLQTNLQIIGFYIQEIDQIFVCKIYYFFNTFQYILFTTCLNNKHSNKVKIVMQQDKFSNIYSWTIRSSRLL